MLRDGSSALSLRKQIASYIEANPELLISESPLREWVLWDSGASVASYCRRICRESTWGGGIEMAVVSRLKRVHVHVYESERRGGGGGYKRISAFPAPGGGTGGECPVVRVLYGGGVHYDALVK